MKRIQSYQTEKLDIREFGAPKDGTPQTTDRRMYFQLLVYTECSNVDRLIEPLSACSFESVLYRNVTDPRGVGVLVMGEDPELFVKEARSLLSSSPFLSLKPKPELTMMGRTYGIGREPDLEDWILRKPRRNALNPDWPWAVWYPLRKKAEFALLSKEEQGKILGEHSLIGRTYGAADFVHDIRLACHGIDLNDNEFIIGLVSSELFPLSRVVQDMRKTQQTARFMQSLGPFFVGHVAWQSALKDRG